MGYIELSTEVPGTKEFVLDLWFRVPQKTLNSIRAEYVAWRDSEDQPPRRRFLGIVPIMTFGKTKMKSRPYYFGQRTVGTWPGEFDLTWSDGVHGFPTCDGAGWVGVPHGGLVAGDPDKSSHYSFIKETTDYVLASDENNDLDGSYIGIDCTGDVPTITVNIVMPVENTATYKGASPIIKTRTYSGELKNYFGSGTCPGSIGTYFDTSLAKICYVNTFDTLSIAEVTEGNADVISGYVPQTFRLGGPASRVKAGVDLGLQNYTGPEITGDHWHNLLLSGKFTNRVRTRGQLLTSNIDRSVNTTPTPEANSSGKRTISTCQMWMSIDDKNLTKSDLSVYWPKGYKDLNAILPVGGMYVAESVNYNVVETNNLNIACGGVAETRTLTNVLPSYDFIPGDVPIGTVALPARGDYVDAIRQVEVGSLRMFTDVSQDWKDEKIRRAFITDKGKPANKSLAKKLFGKNAEVELSRDANWKKGRNFGSLAKSPPEDGVHIGDIKTYKPRPNLHGKQSP